MDASIAICQIPLAQLGLLEKPRAIQAQILHLVPNKRGKSRQRCSGKGHGAYILYHRAMRWAKSALLVVLAVGPSMSPVLEAQEPPNEDDGKGLENYPYSQDLGFGGYDAGQQNVVILRIPVTHLIRSPETHPWGLRLRVPISFGIYNLDFEDFLGGIDSERVRSTTVVPEAEFLIPLGNRWTLKPSVGLGLGKDFHGGQTVLLGTSKLRGVYTRPWKNLIFTFAAGAEYSFSDSRDGLYDDDYARVEVGLDTLIPFGLEVGKRRVDFSLYVLGRHYFRELVFGQVLDQPIVIEQEGEVGITFGSTPRPRIWRLPIPRLLIGYRFGEGLRGIRIKFGLPF